MIGMEENKFVRASEAVIVDSDLLKKKLDSTRLSGLHNLQVLLFLFEPEVFCG